MKRSYRLQNIKLTSLASCHVYRVWPDLRWVGGTVLALLLTLPVTARAAPTSAFSGAIQPAKNCTEPADPSTCDCSHVSSDRLWMPPLVQPDDIKAARTMSYEIHVQNQNWCIPGFDGTVWKPLPASLQTYGYCKAGSCDTITWSIPAPTFRLNKASAAGSTDGTQFKLKLVNELTPGYTVMTNPTYTGDADAGYMDCIPKSITPATTPPDAFTPHMPECFHGLRATNLHFHGSHVSPQKPSDYVLLTVLPASSAANLQNPNSEIYVGSFQYQLANIPYTQAEGTQWYHPHKHGATALQVLSGMVGTLIMEGSDATSVDAFLDTWYLAQTGLRWDNNATVPEKVLMIHQLPDVQSGSNTGEINWFNKGKGSAGSGAQAGFVAPPTLVNGQVNPVIRMYPGEIQRFRFVIATQNAGAAFTIGLENIAGCANTGQTGCPDFRQIAMDGVQFSPENYKNNPLLGTTTIHTPSSSTEHEQDFKNFTIGPGNRADFLVQAPRSPGRYVLSHNIARQVHEKIHKAFERRARQLAAAGLSPTLNHPLLTIEVVACPSSLGETCRKINQMQMPTVDEWPQMPPYLADLGAPDDALSLLFSMTVPNSNTNPGLTAGATTAGQGNNAFYIGFGTQAQVLDAGRCANSQFSSSCAGTGMQLNTTYEWTIYNDSAIAHPFHIHINPFQLLDQGTCTGVDGSGCTSNYPGGAPASNFIWQDTIPLQIPGTGDQVGYVKIRQKPIEYTGPYVLHCHILGHEDRGMMSAIQSVCPDGTPAAGNYGTPDKTNGTPDDCRTQAAHAYPICTNACTAQKQ